MRARSMFVLAIATMPAIAVAAPPPPLAGKSPPACGVKILPLVTGNTWTYTPITAPTPVDPALAKIVPPQASHIVITVQSVAAKGADTIVTLEEKITTEVKDPHDPSGKKVINDDHTLTTTITCGAKKFDISPDSFFFAGEPGGSYGITLDSFDRKGTSWALTNGTIGEDKWREDVSAHWTSVPLAASHAKTTAGKLELERVFVPQPTESIGTPVGVFKAEKLGLQTTGRVTLDGAPPEAKPLELPDAWINTLWLSDNVGLVQVLNKYAHEYQLSAATLK